MITEPRASLLQLRNSLTRSLHDVDSEFNDDASLKRKSSFLSSQFLSNKVQLKDILKVGLETKPDEVALITNDNAQWTWRKLDTASTNMARGLLRSGAKPGHRVASLMPNCAEVLVNYLACIKGNFVMTPLSYRYTAAEIDYALRLSGATILLAHVGERHDDLMRLEHRLPLGIVAFGRRKGVDSGLNYLADFHDLVEGNDLQAGQTTADFASLGDEYPALIFFTSGSTGKPKGVTHTHGTFGWCIASAIQAGNMTDQDVVMPASSFSHIAAMLYNLSGLAVGAPVVVAPSYTADVVLPLLRKARPTFFFSLPSSLLELVSDPRVQKADFASVRLLQSGGDKVANFLGEKCLSVTGRQIREGYGMSEAGAIAVNDGKNSKIGSIGKVVPGLDISIRDAKTKEEVPFGQAGRLWIRGPQVMVGYWNNPTATKETIQDGWMDTGDVIRVDEDGYLWFKGRQKHIIVHDGSNISPIEVEDTLLCHNAVSQVGVVGIPDILHGENVMAYVTLKDSHHASEEELIEFCRARIGYKRPEEIEFLPFMPHNSTGKVDRNALKKKAMQTIKN